MGFLLFYILACIPTALGGVLWFFDSRHHWGEWIGGSAIAFATAGIMHWSVARGMVADEEVWSGEVTRVVFRPEWEERYTITTETTHTRSDGSTYTTSSTSTHYDTHPDKWIAHTTLDQEISITLGRYQQIGQAFGGESKAVKGVRYTSRDDSRMVSGDPYDYHIANRTGHVYPVTKNVRFENRVKASPSVFSFQQLTEEQLKTLPKYPYSNHPFNSERVIGAPIPTGSWDRMMATLGPQKKVNLIIVRLGGMSEAKKLEAAWVGGKKNDLVLTYGPGWAYVFGWTDSSLVKRQLETLLLTRRVDESLIPEIDRLVRTHYELVDWSKFDYLDLEPRALHVWLLTLIMAISQGAFAWWSRNNDVDCNLKFRDE